MRPHLIGIDHAVVLVRDLDSAHDTWKRLGFTLTPRGFHSIGTRNHCIMFGRDYLELLAIAQPHPVTQPFSEFLAGGEGLAAVALATDDAAAVHGSLRADGIEADEPVDFSRPVERSGGAKDARFRIVQLAASATPGCRTFLCQHFTRELVWLPEYQSHPLGVTGIAGITVLAADPHRTAQAYARVISEAPLRQGPSAERLDLGTAALRFETPDAVGQCAAGRQLPRRDPPALGVLALQVADLSAAEAALRRGGFDPERASDGSLAIGADRTHGVALRFVGARVARLDF